MKNILLSAVIFALLHASAYANDGAGDGTAQEVAAWIGLLDEIKQAGIDVLQQTPLDHDIDRAEGVMYLAQQASRAIRDVLIERDASYPLLRLNASTIDKAGMDAADAKYLMAALEGKGVYLLRGTLGSAKLIAIQLGKMLPDYVGYASLSGPELRPDDNGNFQVMIAAQRPADWDGVWLPMDVSADHLIIREYFDDWQHERPSQLLIERLDSSMPAAPLTLGETMELTEQIAERFSRRATMWISHAEATRKGLVNQLSQSARTDQQLANNVYGRGWFKLEPNQALIIEFEPPIADLWSFQLGNFWWESLDYINRTGSINGEQAVAGSDGRYRLVIAATDPGVPNWLDTGGHPEGMIMYRYQNSSTAPTPTIKRVRLSDVREHMPADTPVVTEGQRQEEIMNRRQHGQIRWAP